MNGHLLDTSIVSELAPERRTNDGAIEAWLRDHREPLFVAAIVVAEIEQGICKLRRAGGEHRAARLSEWLDQLIDDFDDRIVAVDAMVARRAGAISDRARAAGSHPGLADILIAATASVHGLVVATRNLRHFEVLQVPCIDPLPATRGQA